MKYLTFNTDGFSEIQIKFLAQVEKQFIREEMPVDLDFLRMALVKSGITPKDGVTEPWNYWKAMHMIIYKRKMAIRREDVLEKWLKERKEA